MADTVKFDALLDDLLQDCQSPEDILGQHGLLKQLTQRLVERALEGELTAHLGYEPHEPGETVRENRRNGRSRKTLQTETGPLPIEVPLLDYIIVHEMTHQAERNHSLAFWKALERALPDWQTRKNEIEATWGSHAALGSANLKYGAKL